MERFGWTYGAGDKVMQIQNDHEREAYNGDLGIVRRVDPDEGELLVDFGGREVPYELGELDALALAYAATVHKAQGSEYPPVVIPLTTQHFPMLKVGDTFDPGVAGRLCELVYAAGDLREPAEAYLASRGRLPSLDRLPRQRGLSPSGRRGVRPLPSPPSRSGAPKWYRSSIRELRTTRVVLRILRR